MAKGINYFKSFCKISTAFGTAATMQELADMIVTREPDAALRLAQLESILVGSF